MSAHLVKPRILAADDDETMRTLLSQMLQLHGAEVTSVADGQAAVMAAALAPFDACVLDVEMPVMDGIEACQRIRATAFSKDLPILMLTARTDKDTIDAAFDAGAWDFVNKPIHDLLLWRRITNMLTLSRVAAETRNLEALISLSALPR